MSIMKTNSSYRKKNEKSIFSWARNDFVIRLHNLQDFKVGTKCRKMKEKPEKFLIGFAQGNQSIKLFEFIN